MTSKQQTNASINQLCHTAENFLVGGLVDQDDRTPRVLFAVADILVRWYAAIPGYSVLENTEDLLEDLRTAMSDLLVNIETQQAEELAMVKGLGGAADQRN